MCSKSNDAQYDERAQCEAETFEEKDKCRSNIVKQDRVILLKNTCI